MEVSLVELKNTRDGRRAGELLSPKFGTKFQSEVPLFWKYQNFRI